MLQYADGCMVYVSSISSNDAESITKKFKRAYFNFAETQLKVNASKPEFITFCQKIDKQNVESDYPVINDHYVEKNLNANS